MFSPVYNHPCLPCVCILVSWFSWSVCCLSVLHCLSLVDVNRSPGLSCFLCLDQLYFKKMSCFLCMFIIRLSFVPCLSQPSFKYLFNLLLFHLNVAPTFGSSCFPLVTEGSLTCGSLSLSPVKKLFLVVFPYSLLRAEDITPCLSLWDKLWFVNMDYLFWNWHEKGELFYFIIPAVQWVNNIVQIYCIILYLTGQMLTPTIDASNI